MKIIAFLFLVSILNADIIPPGMHWFNRCAKITNADSLGEVVLVCYSKYAYNVTGNLKAVIGQDSCLPPCYRYATYYVFWTYRDSVTERTLDGFNYEGVINDSVLGEPLFLLSDEIRPIGAYVEDANPLIMEELYYRLYPGYRLDLWKKISKYSDDRPDSIEIFDVQSEKEKSSGPENVFLSFSESNLLYRLPASEPVTLQFYDPNGKLVARMTHSGSAGQNQKVALPGLAAGTYIVKLSSRHYNSSISVAIRH